MSTASDPEAAKARAEEIRRRKRKDSDVLNADECALFLGFSIYSIRELARTGIIPGRKIGGQWRFSRRQLLKWIENSD